MRFCLATAVLLPFCAASITACECKWTPPCSRIYSTDTIFVGSVKDAGQNGDGPFRFEVEEAFKGVNKAAREVSVWPDLCIAGYHPGIKYLVLAHRSGNGSLSSGDCTGTVPVEFAVNDLRILRAWAAGVPVQELQGRIAENIEESMISYELDVEHRSGLAGVELTATLGEKSFAAISDGRGMFRIQVPEPGTYKVKAAYPDHASTESEYEFSVEPGSCSEQNISMWTDSSLSGVVVDPTHHPVSGIPVDLMLASESEESSFDPLAVKTGTDGSFTFTKVPKGEYLLGINLNGLTSKLPYQPRYYPGVASREAALPVRIGGPATLKNLNSQIGPRLPTRQIRVNVIWPDGRPVTNASIKCASARSGDRTLRHDWISRYADLRGEAVCEVLADRDFEVEADRLNWSDSSRPVQPIATRPKLFVAAGGSPVLLQITIDRINDISDQETPSDMSQFNDREE